MFLYQRINCSGDEVKEDNIYLFINWFHFNLLTAGINYQFEMETHLSLVRKIDFQLRTNIGNSPNFIFGYLKNRLFADSDLLFGRYDLCVDLRDAIRDIHQGTYTKGKHIRQIVEGACFRSEIDDLLNELENDYLNNLLANLKNILEDNDLENNRIDELKYFTNLIISYFLTKGYSYLDLELSFMIDNDSQSKIGRVDKNYSIEINNVDEIINYFIALDNTQKTTYTFYIPLIGIGFKENDELKYNDVEFCPIENNEVSELLKKTSEKYSNWLVDISESSAICKTLVPALSLNSAKDIAFNAFKTELTYFNSLNFNGRINGEFFIGTENGEEFTNFFKSSVKEVGQFGKQVFKNNPFESFRGKSTDAKNRIRRFEPHYITAISEPSNVRELSSLWHYLEVLFFRGKKEFGLKVLLSTILLLDENRYNLKQQIYSIMIELLEKEMPWELRIKDHKTHEELKKGPFDIQKLKSEVKNPFFQFLIKEYETFSTQENLKNSNDYYFRMMDELYSVRNSFLHSGEVIDLSIVKLKYIIPFLISRTRDLLYLEIERDDSFEDIVRYLFSTGKALI